jgi:hypothetical protein
VTDILSYLLKTYLRILNAVSGRSSGIKKAHAKFDLDMSFAELFENMLLLVSARIKRDTANLTDFHKFPTEVA